MKREGSTLGWIIGLAVLAGAQALGLSDMTAARSPAQAQPGPKYIKTAPRDVQARDKASALGRSPATNAADAAATKKPNIVVILGDDVALMDYGVYGGEARTPNINALADRGALFTQHRATPLCSPSRAMLLTGLDNHLTGFATIPEVIPDEQKGKPGYSLRLEEGVLTLADHLRASGYRTVMAGKWHLGEEAGEMPNSHGFDRSFALAASGADNWEDRPYIPFYKDAPWWENGVEADLPPDFYSSRFIVDKVIEYLDDTDVDDGAEDKPFFAYLPFQAVHIPVQAPRSFIEPYRGRYDAGWDALRQERHATAQRLGLIPEGAALAALPPEYRSWDSLSEEEQALYSARMALNAGMIEAMDFHIGRMIEYLKATDQYDNTIFVVSSDNGPEPNRGDNNAQLSAYFAAVGYDISLENLGQKGHWGFIGPEWAAAAATPGAWYKFYSTDGGVRVPLIIAGPGIEGAEQAARRITSPAMISDIAPTLLDWAGVAPITGEGAKAMTGRSLMPVLTGQQESAYAPDEARVIEVSGNAALYKNDYKITRSVAPRGDGQWRLFNLVSDPGETTDLRASEPEIFADLLAEYDVYAARFGVLDMPEGYDSAAQLLSNTRAKLLANYPWIYAVLIGIGLLVLGLVWLIIRRFRRGGEPA